MKFLKQRIRYFFVNYKNIIRTKLIFTKPPKKKILLFDYVYGDYLKKKFYKKVEILHLRLESFNIYIAIQVILKNGIKNFTKNYIFSYIDFVSPKLIITFFDLHPTFYLLQKYPKFKKIKTIAVQSGLRDNLSFKHFKKNTKYQSSISCIFSETYKNLYSKHIKSNKIILGTIKNNYFKKNIKKKQKTILFISQFRSELKFKDFKRVKREQEIIKNLEIFCNKKKINYIILTKPNINKETYIKNFKIGKNSIIISEKNYRNELGSDVRKKYMLLDKSEVTVFIDSTLGIESLSRKNKVLSYPHVNLKKSNNDEFWIVQKNKNEFLKKLSIIYEMPKKKWDKKNINYNSHLEYNPGNQKLIKLIKNFLKLETC